MMKCASIGFLCILEIQYILGKVFSFSVLWKRTAQCTQCYLLFFWHLSALQWAGFHLQNNFNAFFSNNGNIVGCLINWHETNVSPQLVLIFGLDLDCFNLVFKLEIFWSNFSKIEDFQGLKDCSVMFLSDNIFPLMRLLT